MTAPKRTRGERAAIEAMARVTDAELGRFWTPRVLTREWLDNQRVSAGARRYAARIIEALRLLGYDVTSLPKRAPSKRKAVKR